MIDIYAVIVASIISLIVASIVDYIFYIVMVPQTKGSRQKYYGRLYWRSINPLDSDATPQNQVMKMVERWGSPSAIDRSEGGSAIWKQDDLRDTKFERAEIIDHMIPHGRHYDFFKIWYSMIIDRDMADNLYKISETLDYDPLTKLTTVRCNDLRSNVVGLWLAKKYATGQMTLEQAAAEYNSHIQNIMKHDIDSLTFYAYYDDL